ncbi:MAG: hypothetical protein EZS28_009183 [Streblomastix strix]|uniref:C2 domain-containing protein n=1 Tax=Streblomastix strix TaxID=222440 RepID=A0A5J4WL57_9EUKA|nr:MAG: hypothetical protein EZS28_009183 [Streblomastix strix]
MSSDSNQLDEQEGQEEDSGDEIYWTVNPPGTLYYTITQVFNVKSVELFGQSDPYIRVWCDGLYNETQVIKNCANPHFNEKFAFERELDGNKMIYFKLYDKNSFMKDELIGEVEYKLEQIPINKKVTQKITFLSKKGENVGFGDFDFLFCTPFAEGYDPELCKDYEGVEIKKRIPKDPPFWESPEYRLKIMAEQAEKLAKEPKEHWYQYKKKKKGIYFPQRGEKW